MVLKKMNDSSHITSHRSPITDYPRVSIIILNWNGWEDTIECLESLYQITYPNYDVIVVDNGSEDESIEKIKEYAKAGGGKEKELKGFPSNKTLILIKNEKNYGFAASDDVRNIIPKEVTI